MAIRGQSVSFAPIAGPGAGVTSFVRNLGFPGANVNFAPNDIAVISLAQPITTISPVTIAGAVPAPGTVLVSAGYGVNGTGTFCCNPIDNKRRNMTIEFGAYSTSFLGVPLSTQPFLQAQFRDPASPNFPNSFNLTVPTSPLEGGTAGGDSGGPVFVQTSAGTEPGYVSCLRKEDHQVGDTTAIKRLSSAGRPIPYVKVSIQDEHDRPLPVGET